jgi:glycosyltransferase involved in cell wall biosynthesis
MSVAAAIPAFNEERSIQHVVEQVLTYVDRVAVIDDGSTDATAAFAAHAGADLIAHRRNLGKGVALQTALEWARSKPDVDELVLLDADEQHDPADIPMLLEARRRSEADIVVGSRFLGRNNAPLYRLFGLHILSAAAAIGSGIRLTDSQSGYRVLSRRALERLRLAAHGFAVETEMQFDAAAKGLSVTEAPIEIRYAGGARRSPAVHGVTVLLETILLTARRRPTRLPALVATPVVAMSIARAGLASAGLNRKAFQRKGDLKHS